MTFLGSEVYRLLEEVLPARFGGASTDYQIVEEETGSIPRVSLIVAPTVGAIDELALARTALEFLALNHQGGRIMTDQWRQATTLHVLRRQPFMTGTAKVLPLHVLRTRQPEDPPEC